MKHIYPGADTGFEFGWRSHPMHEIEKAAQANYFVGLCGGTVAHRHATLPAVDIGRMVGTHVSRSRNRISAVQTMSRNLSRQTSSS